MHFSEFGPMVGLDPFTQLQVQQQIQVRLLAEIIQRRGGEVVLPPGFNKRATRDDLSIETKFLDDGSYRIRAVKTPARYRRNQG